jgi:Glutathione peroxidase
MTNFLRTQPVTPLYPIPLTLNDGTESDFGRFKGNVVMVVNVASDCGLTPQYAGLEALYGKFRDRGSTSSVSRATSSQARSPAATAKSRSSASGTMV